MRTRSFLLALAPLSLAACLVHGDHDGVEETADDTASPLGVAIYVDCGLGLDTNAGTGASPVKTIRRAMTLVQPGGAIYIRPGVCVERVDVTKSDILIARDPATSGVVEVAGNSPIRLDYTDLTTCNPGVGPNNRACNEQARNRFSTFDLYDVHRVTIRDLTITQDQNVYCTASDPKTGCTYDIVTTTGTTQWTQTFGAYFQQSCLLEKNPDGLQNTCEERPTPNAGAAGLTSGCCVIPHTTGAPDVVCNAPYGNPNTPDVLPPHVCGRPLLFSAGISIQGNSSDIRIEKNDITRIKRGDRTKWITAALPIFVNSRESDARVVKGVHILGNKLHDMPAREIDGNTFGGLLVNASDNVDGFEVGGNTITDVGGAITSNGNYAWADLQGATPLSVANDRVRNTWIHDNVVTRASSYAIYLDGPQRALVERNVIVDSLVGIGVTTEVRRDGSDGLPDPAHFAREIWIRDNIVASTGAFLGLPPASRPAAQALAVGMWLTTKYRANYDPVENVAITNNTFFLSDPSTTPAYLLGYTVNLLPGVRGQSPFRGNVVVHQGGSAMSVVTSPEFPSGTTFSWNDYDATGSPVLLNVIPSSPAGIGDATGFVAAPLLGNGYRMTAASPGRNRISSSPTPAWAVGAPFTSTELDVYAGKRRCANRIDIGADEYPEFGCF